MKRLSFTIINTVARLPELHRLSDAGAGANLMHLTPARDSEIIAYGEARTSVPAPRPGTLPAQGLLSNGGISPAVLVHGLLKGLSQHGVEVHFASFNIGVPAPKSVGQTPSPLASVRHFGGESATAEQLLPTLLDHMLQQTRRGATSILSECGVGGTTFSTLWLRGLTGLPLSPAGSTQCPQKLAHKAALLAQLEQAHLSQGFALHRALATPGAHDPLQKVLCELVSRWPDSTPLPRFGGGMMLLAPLMACEQAGTLSQSAHIDTTRWAVAGDAQQLLPRLADRIHIHSHHTQFGDSRHACLHRYEQGEVVEGCGLGALLVQLESLPLPDGTLMGWLDEAVDAHLQRFESVPQHKEAV
ncbi:hypothetical protein KUW04_18280 [Halomonas denitrificans]|nr:hypothetical protein [Halomonas denitrificans]